MIHTIPENQTSIVIDRLVKDYANKLNTGFSQSELFQIAAGYAQEFNISTKNFKEVQTIQLASLVIDAAQKKLKAQQGRKAKIEANLKMEKEKDLQYFINPKDSFYLDINKSYFLYGWEEK